MQNGVEDGFRPDPEDTESPHRSSLHSSVGVKIAAAFLAVAPLSGVEEVYGDEKADKPAVVSKLNVVEMNLGVDLYCVDRSGGTGDLYTRSGLLAGIDESGVTFIDEAAKEVIIPGQDLISVSIAPPARVVQSQDASVEKVQEESAVVLLADGSRIHADTVLLEDGRLEIKDESATYRCPAKGVQSIRFSTGNQFDDAWQGIVADAEPGAQTLVIKKNSRISNLDGYVAKITDSAVEFHYEGSVYPVPLGKVEGVRLGEFYDPSARSVTGVKGPPPAVCRISGDFGDLQASEVRFEELRVHVTTRSGASLDIPLEGVREFDYMPCKGEGLGDIDYRVLDWTPLIGLHSVEDQFDSMLTGSVKPITVGPAVFEGQEYSEAVKFSADTKAEFYLRSGFDHLIGYVGVDSSAASGTGKLTLSDGERILFEREFAASGPENPFEEVSKPGATEYKPSEEVTDTGPVRIPLDIDVGEVSRLRVNVTGVPITFFSPQLLAVPGK